jgi:hypothetical protein
MRVPERFQIIARHLLYPQAFKEKTTKCPLLSNAGTPETFALNSSIFLRPVSVWCLFGVYELPVSPNSVAE